MKKHYINSVTELLLQGKDVSLVLKNLKEVLLAKGHMSIYGAILIGVSQKLEHSKATTVSTVLVANEAHVATLKKSIEASLAQLNGSLTDAVIEVDPTLIGGYIALHQGKSINNSYKQKLVALYRAITA